MTLFLSILAILLVIFVYYVMVISPKLNLSNIQSKFGHLGSFDAKSAFISPSKGLSFAIDSFKRKIHICDYDDNYYSYDFDSLLQSELLVDRFAERCASASGAVGKVDVDGLLTGNLGNVVGKVQSRWELEREIERIDIKLIFNDISNPIFEINFMITPVKKGSALFVLNHKTATEFYNIFADIVMETHAKYSQSTEAPKASTPVDNPTVTVEIDNSQPLTAELKQSINAIVSALPTTHKPDDTPAEWVTIEKYCELFGISDTATVSGWIARGLVPPENLRIIEELNELQLIKAVPYDGD